MYYIRKRDFHKSQNTVLSYHLTLDAAEQQLTKLCEKVKKDGETIMVKDRTSAMIEGTDQKRYGLAIQTTPLTIVQDATN